MESTENIIGFVLVFLISMAACLAFQAVSSLAKSGSINLNWATALNISFSFGFSAGKIIGRLF